MCGVILTVSCHICVACDTVTTLRLILRYTVVYFFMEFVSVACLTSFDVSVGVDVDAYVSGAMPLAAN